MTTITWPWVPVEILESIISEAWSSPMSALDRQTFITSSSLVNKTWFATFVKIALKDVHIPSYSFSELYFRLLRNENPIHKKYFPDISPDLLCNSLSFTLDTHASAAGQHPMFIIPFGEQERLGTTLSNILSPTLWQERRVLSIQTVTHRLSQYLTAG